MVAADVKASLCKIGKYEITKPIVVPWSYTAGVTHHSLTAAMPKDDADRLFKTKVYGLDITMESWTGEKKVIKNLTCVDIERDNYLKSTVTIVDPRYFIQYLKWVARYNMKRIVNEYSLVADAPKAARDWWLYPEYTWLYWSVKGGVAPSWDNQNPARGTPYNTLELADMIMADLFAGLYGGIKESDKFEKAAPDDLEFVAQPVQSVLQNLLLYARANIAYFPDNKFYIYAVEDDYNQKRKLFKLQDKYRTVADLAGLEIHDFEKQRPSTVRIYFVLEKEIVIEVGNKGGKIVREARRKDKTAEAKKEPEPAQPDPEHKLIYPDVQNVTRVPRNMSVKGVFYARGTYVRMSKMLDELNLEEDDLRKSWRTPWAIVVKYCKKKGYSSMTFFEEHPLEAQLLMGLKRDYRTLYQINPEWMSKILSLKPVRAALVDTVSRTRQPSQVWSNYSGAYMIRICAEYLKRKGREWGFHRYNAPYDKPAEQIIKSTDEDSNRKLNVSEKLSDWDVHVENEKIGIIRFSPIRDLHLEVIEYFPSILDNMPKVAIQKRADSWAMCDLNAKHRAITVMTAIFGFPNNPSQLYYKDLSVTSLGLKEGKFPERWEYLSTRINARQDYRGKLVNQELIDKVAIAEAKLALRSVRDRIEGNLKLGGNHKLTFFGYTKAITYSFQQGGIKTGIHIPTVPPPVNLYSMLKKAAKRAFRELEQEGDGTSAGGTFTGSVK